MGTPKTLNITECHQLLNTLLCKNGTSKQFRRGVRNYTIAMIMLEAGLRVGEVVRLLISDLWFVSVPVMSIIVRPEIAKNGKERQIPVSQRLSEAITEMHRTYWSQTLTVCEGFAFYNRNAANHITTRQVERILRSAAIRSIGRPVHPHILRHTFGTRVWKKAGDRIAQELLGHSSISSTQIYTHPNSDDLHEAIKEIDKDNNTIHDHKMSSLSADSPSNSIDAPLADGNVR